LKAELAAARRDADEQRAALYRQGLELGLLQGRADALTVSGQLLAKRQAEQNHRADVALRRLARVAWGDCQCCRKCAGSIPCSTWIDTAGHECAGYCRCGVPDSEELERLFPDADEASDEAAG
jgi:hypothetical protein